MALTAGPISRGRSLDRRVLPFRVVRRIARGERSEVLLAEPVGPAEPGAARWFALKRLRPELLGDEDATAALRREIEVAARLRHPRLPRVLDRRIEGRSPWMTMSYIDGPDLGRLLLEIGRRGRLPDIRAVAVVAGGVVDALRYLHREAGAALGGPASGKPVLHGSVTPQDVLIGTDGDVRLTDMGRAWFAGRGHPKAPTTRGLMGALSPEELRDQPLTERTDIFHLGTLLYECLTGRHPFLMDSVQATAREVGLTSPPPVHVLRPDVPTPLSDLVQRCLHADPEARWRSAGAVGRALAAMDLPGHDDGPRSLARELISVFPDHNDASRPWVLRGGSFHPPFLPMVLSWLPAPPVVRETALPAAGAPERLHSDTEFSQPPWGPRPAEPGSFLPPVPSLGSIPAVMTEPAPAQAPEAKAPIEAQPTPVPAPPDVPWESAAHAETPLSGFEPVDMTLEADVITDPMPAVPNPVPSPTTPAPPLGGDGLVPASPPSRFSGALAGAVLGGVITALGFALFVPRTPSLPADQPRATSARSAAEPEVVRQTVKSPSDEVLLPLEGEPSASTVPVSITTTPPGAALFLDGVAVGVSPLVLQRPPGVLVQVQARLDGHAAAARLVSIPDDGGSIRLTLERTDPPR